MHNIDDNLDDQYVCCVRDHVVGLATGCKNPEKGTRSSRELTWRKDGGKDWFAAEIELNVAGRSFEESAKLLLMQVGSLPHPPGRKDELPRKSSSKIFLGNLGAVCMDVGVRVGG